MTYLGYRNYRQMPPSWLLWINFDHLRSELHFLRQLGQWQKLAWDQNLSTIGKFRLPKTVKHSVEKPKSLVSQAFLNLPIVVGSTNGESFLPTNLRASNVSSEKNPNQYWFKLDEKYREVFRRKSKRKKTYTFWAMII